MKEYELSRVFEPSPPQILDDKSYEKTLSKVSFEAFVANNKNKKRKYFKVSNEVLPPTVDETLIKNLVKKYKKKYKKKNRKGRKMGGSKCIIF